MMDETHSREALADGHIAPVPRITIQAFCERQDTGAAIASAASDRRMLKAHLKVNMGGASAAVEAFREAPTPNLIVIESTSGRATLIEQLDHLAEFCDAGTKVVVIGAQNDILLYRELISRGVSDYVVGPVTPVMFIRSVSSLYGGAGDKTLGRVIAVTGSKGGVGASTIAHNLAFLLSREYDTPTVLVDLDLGFGTAALNLNQDATAGISEAVNSSALDAALLDRLMLRCTDKLSLLSSPATLERTYDFAEDGLDVPIRWTSWARRVLVTADEIVLVATPDLASLRNSKTMYDTLRSVRPNDAPPRFVLNMVGVPKRVEISTIDFTKAIETNPVGVIPFDAKVFGTAANNGQMLAEISDAGKINETLLELLRKLTGKAEPKPVKKQNLLSPLASLLGRAKAS